LLGEEERKNGAEGCPQPNAEEKPEATVPAPLILHDELHPKLEQEFQYELDHELDECFAQEREHDFGLAGMNTRRSWAATLLDRYNCGEQCPMDMRHTNSSVPFGSGHSFWFWQAHSPMGTHAPQQVPSMAGTAKPSHSGASARHTTFRSSQS
jgi:hypothetical protein